jgi:hypothetical protein
MSHRPAPHELDDVVEPEDRMCAEELALHVESELGEFEHEELFEEGVLDEDDLPDDDVVELELEDLKLRHQVR